MKKFICAAAAIAVGICSVVSLGGCKAGEAIVEYTLSEDETYFIVSGVSGDKLGLKELVVPAEKDGKPVKEIGDDAFFQCCDLVRVTLPENTIEKLGARAFAFCAFDSFVIPDSVTYIGYGAFGACDYLTEITVPESVTTLEPLAFYGCQSLKKAYVKADITTLNTKVFYNPVYTQGGETYTSTSLTELYLPASLEKIHEDAIAGNFISDIYFAGSAAQWEAVYFYNMIADEENEGEKKENRLEKSAVLTGAVKIHCNAEF